MKSVQILEAIFDGLKRISNKEPLNMTITWKTVTLWDEMYGCYDHLVPDVQITYKTDPASSGPWQMGSY